MRGRRQLAAERAMQRADGVTQPTSASAADIARWRDNLQGEWAGAAVLDKLAARVRTPAMAAGLQALAAAERRQADYWASKLAAAGVPAPAFQPSLRDRLMLTVAPRVGVRPMLPLVAAEALRGAQAYRDQP